MPADACKWLVNYGNIVNEDVTVVTPIQVWQYTAEVEAAFAKQKSVMGWTLSELGPKVMDAKKLEFANGMYDK